MEDATLPFDLLSLTDPLLEHIADCLSLLERCVG